MGIGIFVVAWLESGPFAAYAWLAILAHLSAAAVAVVAIALVVGDVDIAVAVVGAGMVAAVPCTAAEEPLGSDMGQAEAVPVRGPHMAQHHLSGDFQNPPSESQTDSSLQ